MVIMLDYKDIKKPVIYKCDNCGRLHESNFGIDLAGHVCHYCHKGILYKYNEQKGLFIGDNNIFKRNDIIYR